MVLITLKLYDNITSVIVAINIRMDKYITFRIENLDFAINSKHVAEVLIMPEHNNEVCMVHGRMVTIIRVCEVMKVNLSTPSTQLVIVRLEGSDTHYGFPVHQICNIVEPKEILSYPWKNNITFVHNYFVHDEVMYTVIDEQGLAQELITDDHKNDVELF